MNLVSIINIIFALHRNQSLLWQYMTYAVISFDANYEVEKYG